MVKHLPTMWETQVRSLGWEDPLEKEMAPHSSTLAWKIPWTEERCRLQSMGSLESDTTERLYFHFHFSFLKCLVEFISELIWAWNFSREKIINYNLILNRYRTIQIVHSIFFFLAWSVCLARRVSVYLSCQIDSSGYS